MSEQKREHTVRPASADDARDIAAVHIRSWQSAYADILPAGQLASLDLDTRTREWQWRLGRPDQGSTWVAVIDGEVVGFLALGPSRDEDADQQTLEIYSVYLDPELWGQGVARNLMRAALAEVPPRAPVTLWTGAENERSQRFYRRHGFIPDGIERLEPFGDTDLAEVRYRRG